MPYMGRKTTFSRNSKLSCKSQKSDIQKQLQPGMLIEILRQKKLALTMKTKEYCLFYNRFGKCNKKEKGICPFVHDPDKIAICTRFLSGSCTVVNCPFAHKLDKSKMPACSHFLEGTCHREECPYRHVRVNPKAPICSSFLKGYCPQGEECKKKHVLVCEEFKTNGVCPKGKNCFLSHKKEKQRLNSSSSSKKKRKSSELFKSSRKGERKIGVLGLVSLPVAIKNHLKSKQPPATRYFESSEDKMAVIEKSDNSTSKSTLIDNVKMESFCCIEGSIGQSSAIQLKIELADKSCSIENEIQKKRERLLKKTEKLKSTYNLGLDIEYTPSKSKDNLDKSTCFITPEKENSSIDLKTDQLNLNCRFWSIPLPDVMPSYIPLSLEENE